VGRTDKGIRRDLTVTVLRPVVDQPSSQADPMRTVSNLLRIAWDSHRSHSRRHILVVYSHREEVVASGNRPTLVEDSLVDDLS
jgi:hypothetical protein